MVNLSSTAVHLLNEAGEWEREVGENWLDNSREGKRDNGGKKERGWS